VGSLLLQVLRAHFRLGATLLQRVDLVPPHEIILLYLDEHGPSPQSDLVRYLARDRSTVTATLQAMERQGLIVRVSSPDDGRAMIVELTRRGRRSVPDALAAWGELERVTVNGLDAEQIEGLVSALTIVRDELINTIDGGEALRWNPAVGPRS
jgi:DNA-binding MarR family transcriptional regulator